MADKRNCTICTEPTFYRKTITGGHLALQYDTPTKSFVHRIHPKPLIVEMNALKEKNPLNQIRKENEAHTTIKMAALHCELVYKSTFSGSRE